MLFGYRLSLRIPINVNKSLTQHSDIDDVGFAKCKQTTENLPFKKSYWIFIRIGDISSLKMKMFDTRHQNDPMNVS